MVKFKVARVALLTNRCFKYIQFENVTLEHTIYETHEKSHLNHE